MTDSPDIYVLELFSPTWALGRWVYHSVGTSRDVMLTELDKAKQSYRDARLRAFRYMGEVNP